MTATEPALPRTRQADAIQAAGADPADLVLADTVPADTVPADLAPAEAKATVTLVLVAAAGLMVSLSLSLLVPVLPRLAVDLHTSATSTEWLLTATLLTGAISVPVLAIVSECVSDYCY